MSIKFLLGTYILISLCLSYNLSIYSSTGFTPYYLKFASEARLPPDLIFGTPSTLLNGNSSPSRGPLTLLFKSFAILSNSFASVRENLQSFYQREKNHYDLGAIERIFTPGDLVRVKLKSRAKGPNKFQSEWSSFYEVISVKSVVITLKELSSNR